MKRRVRYCAKAVLLVFAGIRRDTEEGWRSEKGTIGVQEFGLTKPDADGIRAGAGEKLVNVFMSRLRARPGTEFTRASECFWSLGRLYVIFHLAFT